MLRLGAGYCIGKWVNMALWNMAFWKGYAFGEKSRSNTGRQRKGAERGAENADFSEATGTPLRS